MTVYSKMLVQCTCQEFHHPWTNKCVNATAGILLSSIPYCLKVYTMVYLFSLIMRRKIPTRKDLRKTALGILQSSAFLVTNAYTFIMFNCLIRRLLGGYYLSTIAFVPTFLASLAAIVVERPERRPVLTLYVANVTSETFWNLAASRGWIKSLPNGQVLIAGVSVSVLLYLYRLGLHKAETCRDSIFDILRLFIGRSEEGPLTKRTKDLCNVRVGISGMQRRQQQTNHTSTEDNHNYFYPDLSQNNRGLSELGAFYRRWLEIIWRTKHSTCLHRPGCVQYVLRDSLKSFAGGFGIEFVLKILLNVQRILQRDGSWTKNVFRRETFNLGLCLGTFSLLYKTISCALRHCLDRDDALYAFPAGLIGSVGFLYLPNITVALYIMWKTLQLIYGLGIKRQVLPRIPGFIVVFYSLCTSVLFHYGILEPQNLRLSYYKFLQAISGQRLSKFNTEPFDVFGFDTSRATANIKARLNMVDKSPLPSFSLANW